MTEQEKEAFEWFNRPAKTKEVIVEKVVRVKEPCPPCPPCPPAEKVYNVKTLNIKADEDIDIDIEEQEVAKVVAMEHKKARTNKHKLSLIYGDEQNIWTSSETLKSRFALTELVALIPSHDPITFDVNTEFPANCQEREYHSNKQLQGNVLQRSKSFNPLFLLTDAPTAEDGPPIINEDGVVLGGNSRTMILQRVKQFSPDLWGEYQKKLKKKLVNFGIEPPTHKQFINPVLVRVIKEVGKKCSHYSRILNTSLKNETDDISLAVSLAKQLKEIDLYEIGDVLEKAEAESMAEIFSITRSLNKIIAILRRNGIINKNNYTSFLVPEENVFSDNGRLLVEKILLACILDEKKYITISASLTAKILKNIPYFIRIKNFGEKWNIIPAVKKALDWENERAASGMGKEDFMRSERLFTNTDWIGKSAWDLLYLKLNDFKKALTEYIKIAQNQDEADDVMFEQPEISVEKALSSIINKEKITLADRPVKTSKIDFVFTNIVLGKKKKTTVKLLIDNEEIFHKGTERLNTKDEKMNTAGVFFAEYLNKGKKASAGMFAPALTDLIEFYGKKRKIKYKLVANTTDHIVFIDWDAYCKPEREGQKPLYNGSECDPKRGEQKLLADKKKKPRSKQTNRLNDKKVGVFDRFFGKLLGW